MELVVPKTVISIQKYFIVKLINEIKEQNWIRNVIYSLYKETHEYIIFLCFHINLNKTWINATAFNFFATDQDFVTPREA